MLAGLSWAALGIVAMAAGPGASVAVGAAMFDHGMLVYVLPGLALAGLGRLVQVATTLLDALKVYVEERAKDESSETTGTV